MCAKKLNSTVTSPAIMQVVNRATKLLADSKLGSEVKFHSNGADIETQLWGFNAARNRVVVHLKINDVLVDKINLKRHGDDFIPVHKVDPAYRYKLLTKTQVAA
ncbi:hypothetical protein PQD71_gp156 [Kosakonia phage Kc263]|uniref:Uncharacterized protein n=1 Tax=Kosakonia phage Kc263 TaxID=2863194 RepID=A0AAE8BIL9_9CAUD|nr:hypothetical protein PQD71_gp156 [Kosakonia phage Kc263]QYN80049.1 hypothetical protein [Kosakonia phage Kc263]